ncbi:MAG: multinuclear nonheme iron-dependent oxidase [Steroidobacteraceae bacterium]
MTRAAPLVGIGYRHPIGDWISAHLDRFDVLEVTVDHYLHGGPGVRTALEMLAGRIPLVAHGVGLSFGTDAPLDEAYVREVARVVERLGAPRYSEHLAFTRVPGLDLGNLLPLPKTPDVAAWAAEKVRRVRDLLPVPFDLENISYLFDWPDSVLTDAEFLCAVCEAAGAGIVLDVENMHVNAHNHCFDARAALATIPAALVRGMHMAGGFRSGPILVDSHDHAVPEDALTLLAHALARFQPDTVVLERDDNLDAFDEMLNDVARIRACLRAPRREPVPSSSPRNYFSRSEVAHMDAPLIERQRALLAFLTTPRARLDDGSPFAALDETRLRLVRDLSLGKRLDKVRSVFPVTLAYLDESFEELCVEFAIAFPPYDIGRYENAELLAEFLSGRWRERPPRRAYMRDLVQIELALVRARRPFSPGGDGTAPQRRPAIRRSVAVQLLECGYDVRPLFEPEPREEEPEPRPVCLAVMPPVSGDGAAGGTPRVLELSPELHEALTALAVWRPFDPVDPLGTGAPVEVAARLVAIGLLEVVA